MPVLAILFLCSAAFLIKNAIKEKTASITTILYTLLLIFIGIGFLVIWILIKMSIISPIQENFIYFT